VGFIRRYKLLAGLVIGTIIGYFAGPMLTDCRDGDYQIELGERALYRLVFAGIGLAVGLILDLFLGAKARKQHRQSGGEARRSLP